MRRFTRRPQLKTPQRRPFLRFVRVNSTCVAPTTLLFSTLPSYRQDNRETLDDFDVGSTQTGDVFSLFAASLRTGLTVAFFSSPIFTIHIAYPIPSKNRLFLSQIFQVETLPLSVLSTILLTCFYFYSPCIRSYGGCKMVSFYE